MRDAAILAALLLTTTLTGCLGLEERWEDLEGDLEANPTFRKVQLLNETQEFSAAGLVDPTAPPGSPTGVGDKWNTTFNITKATRNAQVLFRVNFTEGPEDPTGQLPSQRGQIRIFVAPPDDAGNSSQREVFFDASGQGGFDLKGPVEGAWTVGFDQALGQGSVAFVIDATVRT